jgi:hypothetical protein
MSEGGAARAARMLEGAVVALAAAFVLLYLVLAGLRAGHPFELEWLEGGSLEHVRRILEGRPLYGPPSLEFTPFFYAPLYYYAAAGASRVVGEGFFALRLVSVAASLGCFALIGWLVHQETRSRYAALAAVGLFAATYRHTGAWLDLGRGDSLFLLGLLGAAALLRVGRGSAAHLLAALAAAAAVFTKQTALVPAATLGLFALWRDRRRGALYLAALAALVLGVGVAADRLYGSWMSYYTLVSSGRHPLVPRVLVLFWTRDLLAPLGIACLAAAGWFLIPAPREARAFHAAFAGGMMLTSLLSRANVGGYDNVLLPACAVVAVLSALGLHGARGAVAATGGPLRVLLPAAAAVQLAALTYDPWRQLPTAADREAGERVVRLLAAEPGPVFVPGHPYLARRAGKPAHTHFVGINEILTHGTPAVRGPFADELARALAERRYTLVVLDSPLWFQAEMEGAYRDAGAVFDEPELFRPVTGARLRPERLFRPLSPPASSAVARELR